MITKRKKCRFNIIDGVMVIILFIGLGILSYPFIQNALNDYLDQKIITAYQVKQSAKSDDEIARIEGEQKAANKQLAAVGNEPGVTDFIQSTTSSRKKKGTENYYTKHTIGVLSIPAISASLPIFDVTNDLTLQKGAALLDGTSYPIGGKSTHAVISAHRGLSTAELFTKLPKLKIGDTFYIKINKKTRAYQIYTVKTIEPTHTELLKIQESKDIVTLMTCTPYMVNTHRLLVTGKRVPYKGQEKQQIKKINWLKKYKIFILGVGGGIGIILLMLFIYYRRKNEKR
jgi:sortase A